MGYLTGHDFACKYCDYYGKMMGEEIENGDFTHTCQKCQETWVAMTAEEQEDEAKARMDDAIGDFFE